MTVADGELVILVRTQSVGMKETLLRMGYGADRETVFESDDDIGDDELVRVATGLAVEDLVAGVDYQVQLVPDPNFFDSTTHAGSLTFQREDVERLGSDQAVLSCDGDPAWVDPPISEQPEPRIPPHVVTTDEFAARGCRGIG